MGIKNLNRFLRDNCSKKAITKKHLSYFKNKTVVVDTSIYLYKFASEGSLMESMYLFISVLKSYRITPLFIFDGKPPPEKNELLRQRKLEKKDAEQKYNSLQAKLQTVNDNEESKEIMQEMDNLKRQMVKIRDEDIKNVKRLMDAYGVIYYDAPGEADRLCAYLLKNGKAWGCISDDMDMFLYGCKYVIRNVSLMNHTAIYYDTDKILNELDMTENRFCEIMVLSGTDYNINSNTCLNETIKWYYEYMKYANNVNNPYGFYVWLLKNTKYITDYSRLINTYRIFQFNNNTDLENWDNIEVIENEINNVALKEIMGKEGFVFA
jgi:hypothetical protein